MLVKPIRSRATFTVFALIGTALSPGPVLAALAPDSIAGSVYRDTTFVASLREGSENTVLLGSDGRFVMLKMASVHLVSESFAEGRVLLRDPTGYDGEYAYTKTDDSSAILELLHDNGKATTLTLNFTSASGNTANPVSNPDSTFTLTDASDFQTAPAVNISTRGVVSPGHPMIVGFFVPGVRRPDTGERVTDRDANQRDILIRAVGPSLEAFGVSDVWQDPEFTVHRSDGPYYIGQLYYEDWSMIEVSDGSGQPMMQPNPEGVAAFKKIFGYTGAFSLLDDSKDAATVVRLSPGGYTVVAQTAPGDTGGEALVEVYFLP